MYEVLKDLKDIQQISVCDIQDIDSPDMEMRKISENICRHEKLAKFNTTLELHNLTPAPKLPRYLKWNILTRTTKVSQMDQNYQGISNGIYQGISNGI